MAKWQMVRLSKATHARLTAFRDRLHQDYMAMLVELPDDQAEHVSLDYVVNLLLDAKLDHRQRAKRQRQARKSRTADAAPVAGDVYTTNQTPGSE